MTVGWPFTPLAVDHDGTDVQIGHAVETTDLAAKINILRAELLVVEAALDTIAEPVVITTGSPVSVGVALDDGTGTDLALANHVHDISTEATDAIVALFTETVGPVVIVADAAALAALTPAAGWVAYQADLQYLLEWTGAAWKGITDLAIGNGRRWRMPLFINATAGTDDLSGVLQDFPTACTVDVAVPAWATKAYVDVQLGQGYAVTSTCLHQLRIRVGALTGTFRKIRWAPEIGVAAATDGAVDQQSKQEIRLRDIFDVTALQGTTVAVKTEGERESGTGALRMTSESVHTIDVEFMET